MSCENCDKIQEGEPAPEGGSIVRIRSTGSAFYRWKNANIEMNGCDEHLREVFNALNEKQNAK